MSVKRRTTRRGARPQHSLPCALLNLPPPPSPLAPGPAAQTRISGALHGGWRGSSSHEARPSRRAAPQPRQNTDPLTHNSSPLPTRRDDDEDDDEECEACETVPEHVKKKVASGKLWSSSQFPAGTTGVTNWEMSNLIAAQAWECPCLDRRTAPRPAPFLCLVPPAPVPSHFERSDAFPRGRHSSLVRSGTGGGARGEPGSAPQRRPLVSHDSLAAWAPVHRRNCIGGERLKILDLYEHRKAFRTSAAQGRGLRDESRAALQNHYSAGNGTFSRSFVVGPGKAPSYQPAAGAEKIAEMRRLEPF